MKKVNYFSGMSVRPDDLMTTQSYFENRIDTNMCTISNKGVAVGMSNQKGTLLNAPYVWTDTNSLGVYGLIAYDTFGRFIYVEPKFSESGEKLPTLSNLTPDENMKLVVGGSGTFGFNKSYLMVIRYDEIEDESSYRVSKAGAVRNTMHPSRIIPYFELYLRKDESELVSGDVILSRITTDSLGIVSSDESARDVFGLETSLLRANMSSESNSKVLGSNITFDEHINMVGSGDVSITNPHGLSASDLGIDITATGKHQFYLHSDGIKTDNKNSTTSALYPYYESSTITSDERVFIMPLSSDLNEIVVANGQTITPSDISDSFVYDLSNLTSNDYAGFYIVYVSSITKSISVSGPYTSDTSSQFLEFLNNRENFPICSFYWGKPYYTYYTLGLRSLSSQDSNVNSATKVLTNVPSTNEYFDIRSGEYIKVPDLIVYGTNTETTASIIRITDDPENSEYNNRYYVVSKEIQLEETDRYDIDPLTFKDRRVFNNVGFKDFRTDDLIAVRDSAPFSNNEVYLFYSRVESSNELSYFPVGGKTLNLDIDGQSFSMSFSGVQALSVEQLLNQLNGELSTQIQSTIAPRAYINHNKHLTIVASKSLSVLSGTANIYLGLEETIDSGEDIKTLIYDGEMNSVQEMYYNDNEELTDIYYVTAGNKIRSHKIEYSGDIISKISETVRDY